MQNSSFIELNLSIYDSTSIQFYISHVKGEEEFCSDYQFTICAFCDESIDSMNNNLIGKNAVLKRIIDYRIIQHHGIITRIISLGLNNNQYQYTIIMHSPLYLLKLTSHLRTFINTKITDIITEVLNSNQWPHYSYQFLFRNSVPIIDYLVQYNEDDFRFITNLLTRYGLFNYFTQYENYAVWIICDSKSELPCPSEITLNFRNQTFLNINLQCIYCIKQHTALLTDHFEINDYNYLTPNTNLSITTQNNTGLAANGIISLNDRNHDDIATGNAIATLLQQQLNQRRSIYYAQCNYQELLPGQFISLINHPQTDWNNHYQITKLSYHINQSLQNSVDISYSNISFRNNLTLSSSSLFAPPASQSSTNFTPIHIAPLMIGKIVSELSRQNAAIDEYGRYKVSLLLNYNQSQSITTLPIRLIQMYGGNNLDNLNYGCHFPLAVGTVVILSFINGDINRPFILGVFPNQMMPSSVTDKNRTQNKIITSGLNEILFEEQQDITHITLQNNKQNCLLLDATENNHQIILSSQIGELECYAKQDINIAATSSISKFADNCYLTIHNQHLLQSQQCIELFAGNDMKLTSLSDTNINSHQGSIILNSKLQCVAQVRGIFRLQSQNGNIYNQILQGNLNYYCQKGITFQCLGNGNILLKNGVSEINIGNDGVVLLQANAIYINAPKINLQKNVLINNTPTFFSFSRLREKEKT